MNYKSKQHIFDLLELVLKSNHIYYTRLGMEYSFMHPDEILNEFQLAFNDYSEHRVAILKDLIAKLQQQHRVAGSVGIT